MAYRKITSCMRIVMAIIIAMVGISLVGCRDEFVLELVKTGSPETFTKAGERITYTYTVVNHSDTFIENITITDNLVELDCPTINLIGGGYKYGMESCYGTYVITEEDIEAGFVTNKAAASGFQEGGCGSSGGEVEDTAEFTITFREILSLHLTKTGTPTSFYGPGEEISYSYTIKNTGNVPLAGPVTVSDDLVDVECPNGDLNPGEKMVCTGTYTTTDYDLAVGQVKNKATASAGGVSSNSDDFVVKFEVLPQLTLTKTAKPKVFSKEGQLITYTFEIENTGNVSVSPPFVIVDPQLEMYSCPDEALAPGEKMSCTGIYYTRYGDIDGTIRNCATAFGTYRGEHITTNSDCVNVAFEKIEPPEKQGVCQQDPDSLACFCQNNPDDPCCYGTCP
jgi:uncharacterized repeat protein (TIGR01451 family)